MDFAQNNKSKLVSYFCFLLALIMLSGIFLAPGLIEKIIAVVMAALWYQAGAGTLKYKNGSRILAIVLYSIMFVSSAISVYNTIILPLFTPNLKGVGIGRWVAVILAAFSLFALSLLLSKSYRANFNNENPNK